MINFLFDEDDESELLRIKRKAFEEVKEKKKIGPYDYLQTRSALSDEHNQMINAEFLG